MDAGEDHASRDLLEWTAACAIGHAVGLLELLSAVW